MKKTILLLTACLLLALPMRARKVYMSMVWGDNSFRYNATAAVDDGTESPWFHLRDDNGDKIEFKTQISAVNYVSAHGWDLFQVIVLPEYLQVDKNFQNVTKYIFVKDVSDEELEKIVEEGIIHKKIDFKSKTRNPDEELPDDIPVLE